MPRMTREMMLAGSGIAEVRTTYTVFGATARPTSPGPCRLWGRGGVRGKGMRCAMWGMHFVRYHLVLAMLSCADHVSSSILTQA